MPDKPLTVLTYAASASLAAVAIVYFFNPNYLIDSDASSSASSRKKGVVGLYNPANDCFINCVLQSLAGLGDLRLYLIREVHRRDLGPPALYESVPLKDAQGKDVNVEKLRSLQKGEVTEGLKEMMDRLNERPIYKKTISAASFIRVLEGAFRTRIAKSQQDAQEMLQIVAERLSEEYQAGKQARRRASESSDDSGEEIEAVKGKGQAQAEETVGQHTQYGIKEAKTPKEEEDGFPLEGQIEAKTECQYCRFIPKAKPTSFVMLTLTVPQKSSSSLNECFDAQFKTEYIDDYKCDKCRLEHAVEVREKELIAARSTRHRESIERDIEKLRKAIEEDPEKVPEGVALPDSKLAPKRKIGRYAEITKFPKILIIHLSRSIYDPRNSSTKNLSKLSFPERFPIGGLLNRKHYKLLGMVSHKGTHNNGHYETFRRQHVYAPLSNPHHDRASGPYSITATPPPSEPATPKRHTQSPSQTQEAIPILNGFTMPEDSSTSAQSTTSSPRSSKTPPSTRPSSGVSDNVTTDETQQQTPQTPTTPTSLKSPKSPTTTINATTPVKINGASPSRRKPSFSTNATISNQNNTTTEYNRSPSVTLSPATPTPTAAATGAGTEINSRFKRKKRTSTASAATAVAGARTGIDSRWWRISDDKIKECKTGDVLGMQREVYLLFYEIERG